MVLFFVWIFVQSKITLTWDPPKQQSALIKLLINFAIQFDFFQTPFVALVKTLNFNCACAWGLAQ